MMFSWYKINLIRSKQYTLTSIIFTWIMLGIYLPSSWAISSANIPLESPVYQYLDKLSGFGLINSEIKGLRPYSKAEVARLIIEAEDNLSKIDNAPILAIQIIRHLKSFVQREFGLKKKPGKVPLIDFNPIAAARLRYVYTDAVPRDFNRDVYDRGGGHVFGFIGRDLRPARGGIVRETGTEGTPLLENNEGVIYHLGHNMELRWDMETYLDDFAVLSVEPLVICRSDSSADMQDCQLQLQKGYGKVGGGGLEFEFGRDALWFGPGSRGAVTLTNNGKNFDLFKISSPEPIDINWLKRYIGDVKYAIILSRFDETGSGETLRQPYFVGIKLAIKPSKWIEIGGNFVRQAGGPGFSGSSSLQDSIFGGGFNDNSNSIAGFDFRIRIPWLKNTEIYAEYAGEDVALFWPFLESYVAGIFVPFLTPSGKDELRIEYFWGHPVLYTDYKFPNGYTYQGMTIGHSQGGATQDIFVRYTHYFSTRNSVSLDYIHTNRGLEGRIANQQAEEKNAGRLFWALPLFGDVNMNIMYGWERINNFNLVSDLQQTNQIFKVDVTYRY